MLIDLDFRVYEHTSPKPKLDENGEKILDDGGNVVNEEVKSGLVVEIKPLEDYALYQRVLSFLQEGNISPNQTTEERVEIAAEKMKSDRWPEMFKEVLPPHCQNLTGAKVKQKGDIRDATITDLYTISSFFTIAVQIFMQIFIISALPDEEKQNLKKQLPG